MKIISLLVASLDGKITKGDLSPSDWASKEDQEYFKKTLQENNLIVMGSGTFDPHFIKPQGGKLRIILTSHPELRKRYAIAGQIEFTDESPTELITRLEKDGFTQKLLVAGSKVTTDFFKQQLIDELWITIEPELFGAGKHILTEELDVQLELQETKQLNKQGTLLLKYCTVKR